MKRVHMRINGTRPHKNVQQIHASNRQETKKYIHYISIHAYALNIISIHIYIYDIYLRTSYRTVINSSIWKRKMTENAVMLREKERKYRPPMSKKERVTEIFSVLRIRTRVYQWFESSFSRSSDYDDYNDDDNDDDDTIITNDEKRNIYKYTYIIFKHIVDLYMCVNNNFLYVRRNKQEYIVCIDIHICIVYKYIHIKIFTGIYSKEEKEVKESDKSSRGVRGTMWWRLFKQNFN